MSWATKCCYFVPMDWACFILAIGSFILTMFMAVTSLVLVTIDHQQRQLGNFCDNQHYVHTLVVLDMNRTAVDIVLSVVLLIGVLGMVFSVLLLVGVSKNIPNLVLCYFLYSTVVTILCLISVLLELLNSCWIIAVVKCIFSLVNIHFLIVVHSVYELMLNGKDFRFNRRRSADEEHILDFSE